MFSTCLFCHADLGANGDVEAFPVGRRLAFDGARGRLWVVCTRCGRWNLTPLEERWEAIEQCERLFRGTHLRLSTDNVGLARLRSDVELVRIGPALLPEIASWRYGARLARVGERLAGFAAGDGEPAGEPRRRIVSGVVRAAASALAHYATTVGLSDDLVLRMRTFRRSNAVLTRTVDVDGTPIVIRYSHMGAAELVRPDRDQPWRLVVQHDGGVAVLARADGLRAASRLLATLNMGAARESEVRHAIAKLDDAGDPEGYFARVATITMRTSWGRHPEALALPPGAGPREDAHDAREASGSPAERLALRLANRSFWGRGGIGSEERTPLYRLPAVDRLALEMAANEDVERRALAGELAALHAAWREAEEIAAIADDLITDEVWEEFRRRAR